VQTDRDGVRADAEHDAGLGLAEAVPGEQAEQFLVARAYSGERFKGGRFDHMDRRDILRLSPQPKAEAESSVPAAVLVSQNPAGDRHEPGQRRVKIGCLIEPAPGDGKSLRHRVLGVRLAGRASKGVSQDGALVLLEGSLET